MKLKLKNVLGILGPGLISAVAGLEITNIGVFTYIGSSYGYKLLWLVIFASAIIALLQQLAVEIGVVTGEGVIIMSKRLLGKHLTFLILILLYVANIVTIAINLVGASFILNVLIGVPWILGLIVISMIVFAISLRSEYKYLERVLTILSLTLSVYIVLMVTYLVYNPPSIRDLIVNIIIPPEVGSKKYYADVLAIFGAAAAPYALIFQTSSIIMKGLKLKEIPQEFLDIFIGLIFTSLVSISIAVVAAAFGPPNSNSIYDLLLALKPLGFYAPLLFGVGVLASSTLAIEAIILCNAYTTYEYFFKTLNLKDIVTSKIYVLATIVTIALSSLLALMHTYLRISFGGTFIDMVKDSSIIISLTSWAPALLVVLLYWKAKPLASSFVRIVATLIVGSLIAINIFGILSIIGLK